MAYEKLERIEVRFAPKTGTERPWELWGHWADERGSVFWASYATEKAAKKKADSHWRRLKGAVH